MKKVLSLTAAAAALLVFIGGCQKTTVEGPSGKKLTLVKPADQTVKRGETNEVLVVVTRDNFRDPVEVKFENLPAGVQVLDAANKIATEDKTAKYTLKAEPNAALVDNHEVKVTVIGPDGMKATESFRLSVKDKS
jgi:hypothetical protein